MKNPFFSVVILSYNRLDLVKTCLSNLATAVEEFKNKTKLETEIILVDNASTEQIVDFAQKNYPWVKIIANKENLGFAKGNNIGLKEAKGEWLILLNTDAFVFPETLIDLMVVIERRRDAGAIGAQLLNPNMSVQPSGGYLPSFWGIFFWMTFVDNFPSLRKFFHSFHTRDLNFFAKEKECGWAQGAFLAVKKEVFEKTQGMDEGFFMYLEEIEWQKRIKEAGFKIIYTPAVKCVHLGHASSPTKDESFGINQEINSLLYYFRKHEQGWQGRILPYFLLLGCFLRIFYSLARGRISFARAYVKSIKDIFNGL